MNESELYKCVKGLADAWKQNARDVLDYQSKRSPPNTEQVALAANLHGIAENLEAAIKPYEPAADGHACLVEDCHIKDAEILVVTGNTANYFCLFHAITALLEKTTPMQLLLIGEYVKALRVERPM